MLKNKSPERRIKKKINEKKTHLKKTKNSKLWIIAKKNNFKLIKESCFKLLYKIRIN